MELDSPLAILLICLAGAVVFAALVALARRVGDRLSAKQHLGVGAAAALLLLVLGLLHATEARSQVHAALRIACTIFIATAVMIFAVARYRVASVMEAERDALMRELLEAPRPKKEP